MATDNFNRSNGGLGANWGEIDTAGGNGAPLISSNVVIGGSGWAVGASASRYVGATFSADQYSQVVIGGFGEWGTDSGSGVVVRASADQDGAKDYYGLRVLDDFTVNPKTIRIGKYVNGTWTQLSNTTTNISNGDTIRLEVDGSSPANLRAYVNGTIISALTTTDSSLTTGNPGVAIATNTNVDNWEGADLSAGGNVLMGQCCT